MSEFSKEFTDYAISEFIKPIIRGYIKAGFEPAHDLIAGKGDVEPQGPNEKAKADFKKALDAYIETSVHALSSDKIVEGVKEFAHSPHEAAFIATTCDHLKTIWQEMDLIIPEAGEAMRVTGVAPEPYIIANELQAALLLSSGPEAAAKYHDAAEDFLRTLSSEEIENTFFQATKDCFLAATTYLDASRENDAPAKAFVSTIQNTFEHLADNVTQMAKPLGQTFETIGAQAIEELPEFLSGTAISTASYHAKQKFLDMCVTGALHIVMESDKTMFATDLQAQSYLYKRLAESMRQATNLITGVPIHENGKVFEVQKKYKGPKGFSNNAMMFAIKYTQVYKLFDRISRCMDGYCKKHYHLDPIPLGADIKTLPKEKQMAVNEMEHILTSANKACENALRLPGKIAHTVMEPSLKLGEKRAAIARAIADDIGYVKTNLMSSRTEKALSKGFTQIGATPRLGADGKYTAVVGKYFVTSTDRGYEFRTDPAKDPVMPNVYDPRVHSLILHEVTVSIKHHNGEIIQSHKGLMRFHHDNAHPSDRAMHMQSTLRHVASHAFYLPSGHLAASIENYVVAVTEHGYNFYNKETLDRVYPENEDKSTWDKQVKALLKDEDKNRDHLRNPFSRALSYLSNLGEKEESAEVRSERDAKIDENLMTVISAALEPKSTEQPEMTPGELALEELPDISEMSEIGSREESQSRAQDRTADIDIEQVSASIRN